MKGKIGVFMLALLAVSYFLDRQFGRTNTTEEDTAVMIVTGQVTNKATENVVAGVTVEVQASPTKTITNEKGEYSISAKKGAQLVFSHPKYRRMTLEVTEETQDVRLTPKATD
ncbi:MAG: carboxypeptidase-like regulatory domain-containing protein [Prevotella sp.]|jgi:hypothetical protein|nr:carboxypeptidase-like regulatory domain-containing protein [Prevotella sp.]